MREAEDFAAEDLARELARDLTDDRADDPAGGLIGQALRRHYAALLAEPVPDRFLVLLAELESKEAERAIAAGREAASAVPGDPPPNQGA
jgi:hypothetical protein